MLDFLKEILGNSYSEDIDKKISKEVGERFVSKTDFNNLNETKKQLEADISTRDTQLSELQKLVDEAKPEELQATIDDLTKKLTNQKEINKTTEQEFQAKIADMEFSGTVDSALSAAKARDITAAKALLDIDTLKKSKNQGEDINAAIEKLKEDKSFIFESDEPIDHPTATTSGSATPGNSDMATIRAAAGLPAEAEKGN